MSYSRYKGLFKPRNPTKYRGDVLRIMYRSRWELKFMSYLDSHTDVLEWASEELVIPYRSPIDNRIHRYFPDFVVKKRGIDGTIETVVVEIKPAKETQPPPIQNKPSKRYLLEVYNWGINSAKWEAAREFCKDRKWKFIIMTEHDLGIKF
jgi:hypothetical protein